MDEDQFWDIIKRSKRSDPEQQAVRLCKLLAEVSPASIKEFQKILVKKVKSAYRWDLRVVAHIVDGRCSDDGFLYFRAWLVSRGKEAFELALEDPESVGRLVKNDGCENEELLYAAPQAYEQVTGREMAAASFTSKGKPAGEKWDEDDLPYLYPKLCKKFGFS